MEVSVMQCRIADVSHAIAGYAKTGVGLVGWNGEKFLSGNMGDDPGLYYFVPRIAALTHTETRHAISLFLIGLALLGLIPGIIGALLHFKTWTGKAIACAAMGLLTVISLRVGDVYIASSASVFATIPLFLYFAAKNRFTPQFGFFLFAAGIAVGAADWIRAQAGYGPLLFMAVAIGFGLTKIALKQRAALLACLVVGMFASGLVFRSIHNRGEAYLAAHQPGYQPLAQRHVVWHSIYIGLGFLDNPYGIKYLDEIGRDKAASIDPDVAFCSADYERIIRGEVFRIARAHRGFVLETLFAKAGVLLMYLLLFANIGLLAARRIPAPRWLNAAFFTGMAFSALPGLLVMPDLSYVLGYAALAVLYGVVSVNRALEARMSMAPEVPVGEAKRPDVHALVRERAEENRTEHNSVRAVNDPSGEPAADRSATGTKAF